MHVGEENPPQAVDECGTGTLFCLVLCCPLTQQSHRKVTDLNPYTMLKVTYSRTFPACLIVKIAKTREI
jgi:hypothetical protein